MSTAIVILCTVPDHATAERLASVALSEKLAACVNLIPSVTSLYIWKGKVERAEEVQMVLKSDQAHQHQLIDLLKKEHPYSTPELLALPVQYGEDDYLSWISASLR